jgi:hypothetical protein
MEDNKPKFKPIIDCFYNSTQFTGKHTSYFPIYDKLFHPFVQTQVVFVEVGVMHGGSLHMWREFFGKSARIIGIDNNVSAKQFSNDFEIFIGDQADPKFWENFYKAIGQIDILLDDGGHRNSHQIQTVVSGLPHIRSGGLIVVEDTHTSFMYEFGNPSRYSFMNFASTKAQNLTKRNKIVNQPDSLVSRIHSIEFYDSIVAFFINDENSKPGEMVSNSGRHTDAKGFRNTKLSKTQQLTRVTRKSLPLKLKKLKTYRLVRASFRIIVIAVYRVENYVFDRKFRKFF